MYSYIDINILQVNSECKKDLLLLYDKYMDHEFDLLGSGFQRIYYGMEVKGFQGIKYIYHRKFLYEKEKLKSKKEISKKYEPINWFIDYKSGFYFEPMIYNSKSKCLKVIGTKSGVDIKCPWELGRFYHLVQLAILAVVDLSRRKNIIVEFKDEFYDFVTYNPVGKTVQWSSVMDVSIRNVNLLLTYDILKQLDHDNILDKKFDVVFGDLIYKSTQYIIENIERSEWKYSNTNHYLSNLAGIAFAAAYLRGNLETNTWLVFATQEMIAEVKKQYHSDGSNIEGSTSYHRLSTEFVLYTTALIYGVIASERKGAFYQYNRDYLNKLQTKKCIQYNLDSYEFFPQWYIDRVYNAGIFTQTILNSNNEIVQIGDNDSGRLIKLTFIRENEALFLEEDVLNHSNLLSSMSGLFDTQQFDSSRDAYPLEYSFIRTLAKGKKIKANKCDNVIQCYGQMCTSEHAYFKQTVLFRGTNGEDLRKDGQMFYYKDFGILVYKSKRVFISLVTGVRRKPLITGHLHNDVLSVEILVDNKYITRDPGGYIYTPDPEARDRFRSVRAHNTIQVEKREQNMFQDTFALKYCVKGELLYGKDSMIIAKAQYNGIEHTREILIEDKQIIVNDYCNYPFRVSFRNIIYSTGYGKLKKSKIRGINDSK